MTIRLIDVFSDVACKELTGVDIFTDIGRISNGHKINATESIRDFFGISEKKAVPITWLYIDDGLDYDFPSQKSEASFYDARAKNPKRTPEWRLYYHGNFIGTYASPGDLFVLAKKAVDREILGFIIRKNSSFYKSIIRILNLKIDNLPERPQFADRELLSREMSFVETQFLEAIGFFDFIPLEFGPLKKNAREIWK